MSDTAQAETIELLEEVATVGVREISTGRVRVETHVEHVDELARAILQSDVVEVTRVPVGREISGDVPQIRVDGDLTIIPIFEEIMVVEKRLVLKEEIHVRKKRTTKNIEVPLTLRRETADIHRTDEYDLSTI